MDQTLIKTNLLPRRRFAPVPIETTFERYRKGAPTAVLTPSPSPRSPSPPRRLWTKEKEKRRFAPQLIESSRRSRRVGDVGPATKPADKTDITPYHNHIYAPKARKNHRRLMSLARRESCDDETADHFFETLVRENEKRILEDALAAFPNSRARAGGAEHFAIREASDDDSSSSQSHGITGPRPYRAGRRSRRDSLTEDVGWALRELQEHHDLLLQTRNVSIAHGSSPYIVPSVSTTESTTEDVEETEKADAVAPADAATPAPNRLERISTLELDRMHIESPPSDPIWTTTARHSTPDSPLHAMGETHMPYIPEVAFDFPRATDGYRGIPAYAQRLREAEGETDEEDEDEISRHITSTPGPIGESLMPYVASAPEEHVTETPTASLAIAHLPPESLFRGRGPFAGYRNRDLFAERDVRRSRRKSPPMLGKDLIFPKCLSPKQTQLEPEYLWSTSNSRNDSHRDATGKHGLWNGFCYSREKNEALAPIERPVMLATPFPPSSPADPFAHAFSASEPGTVCAEPEHVTGSGKHGSKSEHDLFAAALNSQSVGTLPAGAGTMTLRLEQHRSKLQRQADTEGLHVLMGLDGRLQQEKKMAELEEKIATEFTDTFVTQVYNYLSLGYPAMARAYDDELSKISGVPVADLERDDAKALDNPGHARGHISLGNDSGKTGNGYMSMRLSHDDCPRWHALKLYIYEWARQHPDLDGISSLAWGMRERRGSWGV
ncbi:hypothetical protein CMQ_6635 [Grosmannia clavigera kw1407]|uniref:Uncharacterized protein n=1 Tax=Grosmannia clavigera (strain kw1407 / UAMH 11150) TaxID=655863 RepID=F0X7V9_GROCL|nr:uncharacterized protein CMQ_6635 [Grosmannia clavigera kw1407]EFX06314.1 hypothetical protein CMQ_6635 [Grosmannia clavigera kw1407]